MHLIQRLGKANCDAEEFGQDAKAWVCVFTSVYTTLDVTPYIHALAMHVPEFIRNYGNISMFTQQGLEKLNDLTTKHFLRSTNHREEEVKASNGKERSSGGYGRQRKKSDHRNVVSVAMRAIMNVHAPPESPFVNCKTTFSRFALNRLVRVL